MLQTTLGQEATGKREVILGAKADYLDFVFMVSRKLRDIRRLTATRGSMRGEEPQEHGAITNDGFSQRGD